MEGRGTARAVVQSFGMRIDGGLHVGGTSDPGDNNIWADGSVGATGNMYAGAGLHVGGLDDPGDNNLLVDGNLSVGTAAHDRITTLGNVLLHDASGGWCYADGGHGDGQVHAGVLCNATSSIFSIWTSNLQRVTVSAAGGMHVGSTSDAGANNIWADGSIGATGDIYASRGLHVGSTSDPGDDNLLVDGNCSASSFTDRTPYPKNKEIAYEALLSFRSKDGELDHAALHPSLQNNGGRDLSATVSVMAEVTKDLIARIETLERNTN